MTDTIPRSQEKKDVQPDPAVEKQDPPELVHGLTLKDAQVAFQQDRDKPAAGLPEVRLQGDDKAGVVGERKPLRKLEGVEDWEKVEKDSGKKFNYLDIRQNILTLLPFMQVENIQGKIEDDFKDAIVKLFDKEKSEDVRAKLKALLESTPGESRDKLLKELKDLYKDESKTKIIEGLRATEELRANERDLIDRLQDGVRASDLLKKLSKDGVDGQTLPKEERERLVKELKGIFRTEPDKLKILNGLKDGEEGKKQIAEVQALVEKDNYLATMLMYPTMARFVDVATRQLAGEFQDMKIGDTADVRAANRFPEGAPYERPSIDGVPISWDLYLTKIRKNEIPCTVSPNMENLLSDSRAVAFTNAADWLNKSQGTIAGIERKYDAQEVWRRLQNDFKAPESWAPPDMKDGRALDAWFNSANTVRREITTLRDYVQAYLDLKEVTPDLRDKVIKGLQAKGYEIEWDPLNNKLTKFKPAVPADLRILSPKVDSLIKEWQAARREIAEPIDKILETHARGDKNFLKQGKFTGPQDRGFLLMEEGKIKFVVELEEVKKEDAAKKVEEAKAALTKLQETKTQLDTDLGKAKTTFDEQFKDKKDLTKLETEEKQQQERNLRKLEGEVEANKKAIEKSQQNVALCEERKDGGKFPGRVISYVRRVDGKEEVIDRNLEGRFVTKGGVDVSDEVEYKPDNFKEKNRVQFDYVSYSVTTENAKNAEGKDIIGADGKPQVRINTKRDYMWDHAANFYHAFGVTEASLTKPEDHNTNDYVGVVSNVTGKIRFMRADDIGGFFGWKAGQAWQEGLTVAANVVMDVAMIYLGGAGIYSGIAKKAFGSAALGAMRMSIGLTGFPFGPALRQTEWGQEALKWRHRAMMFDVFVLGLGGGALNLVRGSKAAAEAIPLSHKIAHYGMLSTTAVYGPEIMADIYHKMQLIKGEAPIQCAHAAGNDISIRSKNLDRLSKPYDFKDAQIRKATGDTLDSYETTLLTGVDDATAKANIQAMTQTTKKLLDPAASAAEKENYKRELVRSLKDLDPKRKSTHSEKVAAASCLILLNTDEKGGVSEVLAKKEDKSFAPDLSYSYKDALKLLREQVAATPESVVAQITNAAKTSQFKASNMIRQYWDVDKARADEMARILTGDASGPIKDLIKKRIATQLESSRLIAADRLSNLKDPETGKPALAPRQLAAVCVQIVENKELPETLRKRALFDPSRPRLGFLMNELEAEEQAMNAPGVSAADRQAFFGNINGFHTDDIKTLMIKLTEQQTESADLRAMSAMTLHLAGQEKLEDRVRLLLEYSRNVYGATDEKIPDRSGTKNAVAKWFVEKMNKDLDASIENPRGKSADEVRADKLTAAVILRGLGKLNADDKDPILSPQAYNAKLLECITRPGGDAKKRELMLPKDRPDLVSDIIGALSVSQLTTAERQTLLGILDLPTNGTDGKANNAAEKAKIAVLAMMPQMIAGTTDSDIEMRLLARQKLQANLDPSGKLFAGDRPILRMALCCASGEAGMDDPDTVALLKKTFDLDKDKNFFEQSPLVRRAALEALVVTSQNDAIDIAKRLKDRDEKDGAVFRRAASIADLARVQSGGQKDREEVRQDVIFKLSDKEKCNLDDGKNYLSNSKFKILNWADYVEAYKQVQTNAEPGQGSLLSLSRLWVRVSNFDYGMPDKMMKAAASDLEGTRSRLPDDLVNVAKTHTDQTEARKAILALAFGLETKAESFATNSSESRLVKAGFQVIFAQGLRDLCGKDVTYRDAGRDKNETIPNKQRLLVATICEGFVTGSQQIDWQARYHLYEGLKKLRKDNAISPADYAEILTNAMHSPIKNQIFPTNEREIGWCKKIYAEMINELVQLKPRDEKTLGLLKGLGDGLRKQGGWEDVSKTADRAHGLLMESSTLAFMECKDKGSIDKPEALAARLDKAYLDYRQRLVEINKNAEKDATREQQNKTKEEIRKNRDNLVTAIYKLTEGNRIADLKDPRVKTLMQMAVNVDDLIVKEAVGTVFQRVSAKDGFLPWAGRILWAEVLKNGTPFQKDEMQTQFDLTVKAHEEFAKKNNQDPVEARKRVTAAIDAAKSLAESKQNATTVTAFCFQKLTGGNLREYDPDKVNHANLLTHRRNVEDLMAKQNVRPEQFAWAMIDMMCEGAVVKDDPRLGIARRILMEGFPEHMKMSAAMSMLFYDMQMPEKDQELAVEALYNLSEKATNASVKSEAASVIAQYSKAVRMEAVFKRVKERLEAAKVK